MKFIKKRTKEEYGEDFDEYYDSNYYDSNYYDGANADGNNQASFDGDDAVPVEEPKKNPAVPGVSFAGGSAPVALKLVTAKGYDDGPDIADDLINGSTVLLNIEGLERPAAKRLIDFLLGATHVLGGNMKMVTKTTLVFAPKNVGVSGFDGEEHQAAPEAE